MPPPLPRSMPGCRQFGMASQTSPVVIGIVARAKTMNITTLYGKTEERRIFYPEDPTRAFSWLICEIWKLPSCTLNCGGQRLLL